MRRDSRAERGSLLPLEMNACLPGCVWNATPRSLSPLERNHAVMIQVKRVYEPPTPDDGTRFLVDRLWPRGIKKEDLRVDQWVKGVAPSDALRLWFAHDPGKWNEFRRRYFAELDGKPDVWLPIVDVARQGNVTLLYSARDTQHNNAVALKEYVEKRLAARGR